MHSLDPSILYNFLHFSEFQSLNILICLMGLIAVLDFWCGLEILHVKYLVFDWQKVGAQWVMEVFMAFSPSTVSYKAIPCLQRALGVNSEVLALSNRAVWSCRKSLNVPDGFLLPLRNLFENSFVTTLYF